MNINILGMKLDVQMLILIGVVFLILMGHSIGGCCGYQYNTPMFEGFEGEGQDKEVPVEPFNNDLMSQQGTGGNVMPGGGLIESKAKQGASKQSNKVGKEGFTGINTSVLTDYNNTTPINTKAWDTPNLTVVKGQPVNADVKHFLERKQQPLPLPEGELTFFANTEFKPECCPNSYSNSMGCACMTSKDYNYLIMRGGNNVPYSEY